MDRRTVILSLFAGLGAGVTGEFIPAGDKPADPAVLSKVLYCNGFSCQSYFDPIPCIELSVCESNSCSQGFGCNDHQCHDVFSCNGANSCTHFMFFPPYLQAEATDGSDVIDARTRLAALIDLNDSKRGS